MNELHLFAGAGGGILGGILLGHTCVCAVEIEPYCRKVMLQRQRDGLLPKFPIWDDVRTFDGTPWRGRVDVVCGGFPCQDISAAGNGEGISGQRSGLWGEMARIIREIRPKFAFVENSPVLTSRGIGKVLADMAEMGMDARWGVLGAEHANAIHRRHRIFILAYSDESGLFRGDEWVQKIQDEKRRELFALFPAETGRWPCKNSLPSPKVIRSNDGVARIVDRLKAVGNGQVPAVAKLAWEVLSA